MNMSLHVLLSNCTCIYLFWMGWQLLIHSCIICLKRKANSSVSEEPAPMTQAPILCPIWLEGLRRLVYIWRDVNVYTGFACFTGALNMFTEISLLEQNYRQIHPVINWFRSFLRPCESTALQSFQPRHNIQALGFHKTLVFCASVRDLFDHIWQRGSRN